MKSQNKEIVFELLKHKDRETWINVYKESLSVSDYAEPVIKEQMRQFVKNKLNIKSNECLMERKFQYSQSETRISAWMWFLISKDCYKCHAEVAFGFTC